MRYYLTITEEVVQNPQYQWGRGGRIEVYDEQSESSYPINEYRFFIPNELFDGFFDAFSGKETNYPVKIVMNWELP